MWSRVGEHRASPQCEGLPHTVCPQVFICGPSPHWLLVTGRGALRLHPMGIDGPIDSFAPFHNINCPRGFLYFNRQVGRPHEARPGVPTPSEDN